MKKLSKQLLRPGDMTGAVCAIFREIRADGSPSSIFRGFPEYRVLPATSKPGRHWRQASLAEMRAAQGEPWVKAHKSSSI